MSTTQQRNIFSCVSEAAAGYRALCDVQSDDAKDSKKAFQQKAELCAQQIHSIRYLRRIMEEEEGLLVVEYERTRGLIELSQEVEGWIESEVQNTMQNIEAVENIKTFKEEEEELNGKMEALNQRLNEMTSLVSNLETREKTLEFAQQQLRERERNIGKMESEEEERYHQRRMSEEECARRQSTLVRREDGVSSWHRALEHRETDLLRSQAHLERKLAAIQADEQKLGLLDVNVEKESKNVGKQPVESGGTLSSLHSIRTLGDAQHLSIDRDDEED